MLRKRLLWPVLAVVLVLLAAGCGSNKSSSTAGGASKSTGFKFAVVTHGQASDPFWSVVKNGVDQAAKDEGVTVSYQAPGTFDMVAMSRLIDAAVASKPDGLVVSIPDANALGPSIKKAVAAGIPVVSINSGSDVFQSLGVLTHVGQTEFEAGLGGGERMGAAGVKNALCVNQEVGNAALDLRCKGFTDALRKTGGAVKVLAVNLADPTDAKNRISGAIRSAGNIDGVLALGPTGSTPALQVLQSSNQLDLVELVAALQNLEGRGGTGGPERQDPVDVARRADGARNPVLGVGRVGEVDGEHLHRAAGLPQGVGEALAAQVERGVADLLVHAQRILDPGRPHALIALEASLVLSLADVGEDAEAPVDVAAGVDRHDRDAGCDRLLDRGPEGVRIGDRHHQAVRLGGHRRVDQPAHRHHVEGARRLVADGDAFVLGRLVNAILHDRPEGVGGLAVGHHGELEAGRLAGATRGRAALVTAAAGGEQDEDDGQHRPQQALPQHGYLP